MIKLSERLSHLAEMVSEDAVLADVGTDHGYLPIYLLQTKRIRHAYAMDIGMGPLLSAQEHVTSCGLGEYITLRRSDGVEALAPSEADTILIAGMGGNVILHILTQGEAVISAAKELILQPQSEIARVREYLYRKGYEIDREDMVYEDGKYYPMMHILCQSAAQKKVFDTRQQQVIYRYGERLLQDNHEVLHQYLLHQTETWQKIAENLAKVPQTDAIIVRRQQVEEELCCARAALAYWDTNAVTETANHAQG